MLDVIKPQAAPVKTRLKGIALPNEHGAWGMLFEPIVAASAIAFSTSTLWISLAVIAAFLIRQPLKVMLMGMVAGRSTPQAAAASRYLYIYASIFAVAAAGTLAFAPSVSYMPLILAGPLAAIPVYYDAIGKSRNLAPELAGSVAITSSAAMIALAGGWTVAASLALWAILLVRWVPSIMYVRNRLLLEKGKSFQYAVPAVLAGFAFLLTGILASYELSPRILVVMMGVLFARTLIGLSKYRRRLKAKQIGVLEVIFGTVTVIAIIVGYKLGL